MRHLIEAQERVAREIRETRRTILHNNIVIAVKIADINKKLNKIAILAK
jgi:hypothetical protein